MTQVYVEPPDILETLADLEALARAATPGLWKCGGPVKRESVIKTLSCGKGPNGLSENVFEVGRVGDKYPPGLCVVNDYRCPGTRRRRAATNAAFIAAVNPAVVLRMIAVAWAADDVLEARDDLGGRHATIMNPSCTALAKALEELNETLFAQR